MNSAIFSLIYINLKYKNFENKEGLVNEILVFVEKFIDCKIMPTY